MHFRFLRLPVYNCSGLIKFRLGWERAFRLEGGQAVSVGAMVGVPVGVAVGSTFIVAVDSTRVFVPVTTVPFSGLQEEAKINPMQNKNIPDLLRSILLFHFVFRGDAKTVFVYVRIASTIL